MASQTSEAAGSPQGPQTAAGSPLNTALLRACETCRSRKIRCDRHYPCFNCVQSKIHERKIDHIDSRLEELTRLLEHLTTATLRGHSETQQSKPEANADVRLVAQSLSLGHTEESNVENDFVEGESSFATHSAFAKDFVERVIGNCHLQDPRVDMQEALGSLQYLVTALKHQTGLQDTSYPLARIAPRRAPQGSKLPPIEKVAALIRGAKTNQTELSGWLRDLFPPEYFSDICLRVYFSEDFSEADFILANFGLQFLFAEQAQTQSDNTAEALRYARVCETNLEMGLANLPLHLPANIKMIVALLSGAIHAIDISKPSLAATLSAKASELSRALGYHRLSIPPESEPSSDTKQKQILFWCLYIIDKSLALRLGCASNFQDWDISTPMVTASGSNSPVIDYAALWVKTARCQGSVYELLYSPESMNQPDHVRQSRVNSLDQELHAIQVQARELWDQYPSQTTGKSDSHFPEFIEVSDDVLRLSLLTLLHRASPLPPRSPATFVPACIDAARSALERHQDFLALFGRVHSLHLSSYIHWTLLFAPFIPFIVLFCHTIETGSQVDLNRLDIFVTSLESAPSLPEAVVNMHRLFKLLRNIAGQHLGSQALSGEENQSESLTALNDYLTGLGLPLDTCEQQMASAPSSHHDSVPDDMDAEASLTEGANGQDEPMTALWPKTSANLRAWLNRSHQVMELLDEPSFIFPS